MVLIDDLINQRRAFFEARPTKLPNKKAPAQLFPINAQKRYLQELTTIIDLVWELTQKKLISKLPSILAQAKSLRPKSDELKTDDYSDQIEDTFEDIDDGFTNAIPDHKIEEIAHVVALLVSTINRREVLKVISSLSGVYVQDILLVEPYLKAETSAFIRQNISLIKTIPEQYLSEVKEIVYRGALQGTNHFDLQKEIQTRLNVSKNRAKVIARDQVGKLNGQLTQLRQQSLGIKEYRWRTAKDERVRGNPSGLYKRAAPSHWHREGKTYKWSKPPVDGHPGQAILCRCVEEPVFPKTF